MMQENSTAPGSEDGTPDGAHVPVRENDPTNGRFLVISAAQELQAILHCAETLGMTFKECSLGTNLIGHRLLWTNGESTTEFWLVCAASQRVDTLLFLITLLSERFSPRSIILTGMMGGIPGKIGFLDVVAPTAIYDGRIVGTREKQLVVEPESGPVHQAVHTHLNNIPEFKMGEISVKVKKNKKSMTVAAKHDDISHELFTTIVSADAENIVAFEMEGQAVVNSNQFQQLVGNNVVLGMIKGVADFGGLDSLMTAEELEVVKSEISYSTDDGDFDPIVNKTVKAKLQFEATRRALFVSVETSRRF